MADAAGSPGEREVLAFDLYGTLVDPIAIAAELGQLLGQLLGDAAGREAARLWRLTQLEYSFRLTGRAAGPAGRADPARHLQRVRQRRASAAGMRTAWINRSGVPFDTIGARPDLTVPALDRLPAALSG